LVNFPSPTAAAPKSLAALIRLIAAAPPMVKGGTCTVLGEGPRNPDIAFAGEQPGDQEDLASKPFVGPAGRILDKAMADAGIVCRKKTEQMHTKALLPI
jgi:DNA polymerase